MCTQLRLEISFITLTGVWWGCCMDFTEILTVASGLTSKCLLDWWICCFMSVKRSPVSRVLFTRSTHASDSVILPCQGCEWPTSCPGQEGARRPDTWSWWDQNICHVPLIDSIWWVYTTEVWSHEFNMDKIPPPLFLPSLLFYFISRFGFRVWRATWTKWPTPTRSSKIDNSSPCVCHYAHAASIHSQTRILGWQASSLPSVSFLLGARPGFDE